MEGMARQRRRIVDELGRAYATGKRKTSIARVWLRRIAICSESEPCLDEDCIGSIRAAAFIMHCHR